MLDFTYVKWIVRILMALVGIFFIMSIGFDTFFVISICIVVFVGSLLLYDSYRKDQKKTIAQETYR